MNLWRNISKFHQSHHGDKKNKIIKISQNNINIIASYNPKMFLYGNSQKIGPHGKLAKEDISKKIIKTTQANI